MAVDLFRLLDIKNRKTFSQKGRDGKEYRKRLISKTLEIEKDLRNILPSNYLSNITGPNYTIALRAYAIEFSRIRIAIEDLQKDCYFNNTEYAGNRADIIYQKLGSMLALNQDLDLTIFSSQEFLQFILALIEIFFAGSTPENIKKGIEKFVNGTNVVSILENFRDARNSNSAYDISDQFGFRVDFELTDEISKEFQDLGIKLNFLLKLIKPAHTLYVLRFIFKDLIEFIKNADDSSKIESIWDHGYEDLRRYWDGVSGRDRLGINTTIEHTEILTNVLGNIVHTINGPISKNQTLPELAEPTDVTVLVDGGPVTIDSVSGSMGIITLQNPVTPDQILTITYYYWKNVAYQMTLNDQGKVIGSTDRGRYPVQWVLNRVGTTNPQRVNWSYGGFERNYTSLLNDPTKLLLNEPPNKISNSSKIYGHKHVLNWSNYVKSPNQTDVDGFIHYLNEGTPIVELRIAYNSVYQYFNGDLSSLIWEGWGEQSWGDIWGGVHPSNDSTTINTYSEWEGWGIPSWGSSEWGGSITTTSETLNVGWNTLRSGGHFADPLDVVHVEDGGYTGLISIAHDDGIVELNIDSQFTDSYSFPGSIFCDNYGMFTLNTSNLNGLDLLNNFAGVSGFELTQDLSSDTPETETTTIVTDSIEDDPVIAIQSEDIRHDSYDTSSMFILNVSDLNSSNTLWSNYLLEHWSDEGNIIIILGASTYHLEVFDKELYVGLP